MFLLPYFMSPSLSPQFVFYFLKTTSDRKETLFSCLWATSFHDSHPFSPSANFTILWSQRFLTCKIRQSQSWQNVKLLELIISEKKKKTWNCISSCHLLSNKIFGNQTRTRIWLRLACSLPTFPLYSLLFLQVQFLRPSVPWNGVLCMLAASG